MIDNIRALVNDDGPCIGDALAEASDGSPRLQLAVAFLSDDNLIRGWLKKGRQLEILVARHYPTNPRLLRSLLHTSGKNVELKWLGPEFHAKVIIGCTKTGTPQWASIGSANLTTAGLSSNDEFNLIAENKAIIQYAAAWFQRLWETAAYVNPEKLKKYEDEYDKVLKGRTKEPHGRAVPRDFNPAVIAQYKDYWNAVDIVEHAVRSIIRHRFPACRKHPYLAIWSFWPWLMDDCPTSAKHLLRRAATTGDSSRRDNLLRDLFRKYSDEYDPQWPRENVTRMRRMQKMILRGRVPSTTKLLEIIDFGYRNK